MKHWRSGLTLVLAGISVVPVVHEAISATYTASPTVSIPTDCTPPAVGDLQSCLDLAAQDPADDIVLLQPGTYSAANYVYQPSDDDDGGALTVQNESATLPVFTRNTGSGCLRLNNTSLPSDLGANLIVRGLVFQDCDTFDNALDIQTRQASITVENNTFIDNSTGDDDGGGADLVSTDGNIVLQNNLFEGNQTNFDGGAAIIFTGGGDITVSDNQVIGNTCGGSGGGMLIENSDGPGSITIVNNVVARNTNGTNDRLGNPTGGGLSIFSSALTLTLTNNTIVENTSQSSDDTADGGGIAVFLNDGVTADIYNNIIFGNTAQTNGDDIFSVEEPINMGLTNGGTLNLFNNDFTDFYSNALDNGGDGTVNQGNNIDADPLFANAAANDFNLTANSPAIDKGDPNAPSMPNTDLAGNPRPAISGTNPDMGAFEFQPEPSASPTPPPVPPVPPVLLQGTGCALQSATMSSGAWMHGVWILALGVAALRRRK